MSVFLWGKLTNQVGIITSLMHLYDFFFPQKSRKDIKNNILNHLLPRGKYFSGGKTDRLVKSKEGSQED